MNKVTRNQKEKPPKKQRDNANFTLTPAQQNEVIREWLRWAPTLPLTILKRVKVLSVMLLKKTRHSIYCFFTE